MPQITAVQQQVKNTNRYSIFIDDKFAFGIDEGALIQLSIKKGQEVDEKQFAEFLRKSEQGKLYQKVLRFLVIRPRSEKEVKDYLWRKINRAKPPRFRSGASEGNIGEADSSGGTAGVAGKTGEIIERLKRENYLNDLEFAGWWLEQRQLSSKPRGDRLIRLELRQKGIDEEIIKEALDAAKTESANQGGEVETPLQKLIKKQWPKYRLSPRHEAKNKLIRYLLGRGFDYSQIKTEVDKALALL